MGYDRHLSGKTGAVTRKNRAFERAQVRLTDNENSGTINIEIDEFVPCLKDAKTGEILATEVSVMNRKDLKKYTTMKGDKFMSDIIHDPDCEGFDGRYVDNSFIAPPAEFNYALLGRYMRENNKEFKDLTPEELEQFKI